MTTTNTSTRRAAAARKLNRFQKLLTAEQARRLPLLYSTDGQGDAAVAHVKFFLGAFTWYATEFDPATGQFFGLVDNVNMRDQLPEGELGYFSADELQSASVRVELLGAASGLGSFRQPVERDIHWQPQTLAAIRAELRTSAVNRLNSAYRAAIAAEPTAEPADAETEAVWSEMVDEARNGYPAETPTAADRFAAGYNRINWGK